MKTYSIDSTSVEQVRELVYRLIAEERLEYRVENEYGEEITPEIHALISWVVRKYIRDARP
jgi:hypothetical protein